MIDIDLFVQFVFEPLFIGLLCFIITHLTIFLYLFIFIANNRQGSTFSGHIGRRERWLRHSPSVYLFDWLFFVGLGVTGVVSLFVLLVVMEEGYIFFEKVMKLLVSLSRFPFLVEAADDVFFVLIDFGLLLEHFAILFQHLRFKRLSNSYYQYNLMLEHTQKKGRLSKHLDSSITPSKQQTHNQKLSLEKIDVCRIGKDGHKVIFRRKRTKSRNTQHFEGDKVHQSCVIQVRKARPDYGPDGTQSVLRMQENSSSQSLQKRINGVMQSLNKSSKVANRINKTQPSPSPRFKLKHNRSRQSKHKKSSSKPLVIQLRKYRDKDAFEKKLADKSLLDRIRKVKISPEVNHSILDQSYQEHIIHRQLREHYKRCEHKLRKHFK